MTGWLWRGVVCVCVWALLAGTGVAQGGDAQDDSKARAHFKLGHEHYADGEFLDAAEQFEKAYTLSPRPMLLFNAYVAYRDANELEKAADALRRYLDADPNAPNRKKLEAVLRGLEEGSGEQNPGTGDRPHADYGPEPEPADHETQKGAEQKRGPQRTISVTTEVTSSDAERIPDLQSDNRPRRHDERSRFGVWPYVIMGGGGALLAGALVTGLLRNDAQDELESGCPTKQACAPELESTRDEGRRLSIATDVLWIGGAVAVGTGLVLWILDHTDDQEHAAGPSRPRAGLGCSTRGCSATLEVGF